MRISKSQAKGKMRAWARCTFEELQVSSIEKRNVWACVWFCKKKEKDYWELVWRVSHGTLRVPRRHPTFILLRYNCSLTVIIDNDGVAREVHRNFCFFFAHLCIHLYVFFLSVLYSDIFRIFGPSAYSYNIYWSWA